MARFRLPNGADGLELQDGTTYRASGNLRRGGVVDVDNPAHERALLARSAESGTGITPMGFKSPPRVVTKRCASCGFNGFKFQSTCPRCEGVMEEVQS